MHLKGYQHITYLTVGWDSTVNIAACHGQDGLGIKFQWWWDFSHLSRSALGPTQPPINGYQIILGVKWPEHGVNHPPPSSAEAKGRVEVYLYSPTVPSWLVIVWSTFYIFNEVTSPCHHVPCQKKNFCYGPPSVHCHMYLSYCLTHGMF
jgi:hypothetical protein